jgi:hypothetical protein
MIEQKRRTVSHFNTAAVALNSNDDRQLPAQYAGPPPTVAGREVAWVHPMRRKRPVRRVDPYAPGRLRAEVRIKWPSPPENVLEAQREALAAIDVFEKTGQRVLNVGQDAEDEKIQHDTNVAEAYRNDRPLPKAPSTDWHAEKVIREIQHNEAFTTARQAVASFGAVVLSAQPEWLARLVETVEPSHEAAQKAMKEAARAVRAWRSAVDSADEMSKAIGEYGPTWHMSPSGFNISVAMAALTKLIELVESKDPVVTGQFLNLADPLSPPSWTREALERKAALGADWARVALMEIEDADKRDEIAIIARGKNLRT